MTKQQTKLINMLLQFHNVCENNEITYYLIGNQLLYAAQNNSIHGYEVELAMYEDAWEKLLSVIDIMPDIEVEEITNGGRMPGCYFRYIDRNTLLLDLDYYGVYAKPAVGLNIYIIRDNKVRARMLSIIESMMSYQVLYSDRFGAKIYNFLIDIYGRKRYAHHLSKLENAVRSRKKSGRTTLKEAYGKTCTFSSEFWLTREEISFMGYSFYTVSRYKEYLKKRYGVNWLKTDPKNASQTYRCVFSDCLPYREYMEAIQNENLLPPDFIKQSKRFLRGYESFKDMMKEESLGWDKTIFAAGERFRLWKKYMPIKKQVADLIYAEKYDEAELILEDYINVLQKYIDIGIVMCFDKDFLEFVKKLYVVNGQMDKVKFIDTHVLKEDLIPIEI